MVSPKAHNISLRGSEDIEQWRESTETQRLIDHEPLRADDKVEPDTGATTETQPPIPPAINPESPIRLAPADNHPEGTTSSNPQHSWRIPDLLEAGREEERSILRDIGRGFLLMFMAPLALAGMGLYVCGLVIEGIAMVLKGIGLLGAKLLMRRHRGRAACPEPYGLA
ncbi:hypothetical protein M413DRAFT_448497 [Hebeloma cylindrosporum]|uniref:Uncharacterized protein n=1 Tax=Hebeloma cylindrosporum TaxID=76867 RepID=A0A0C2XHU6_HEBCY|nr:hypothetical protein M413DRAFT_448497 [Hebeloma cylindrosporum h7]